MVLFIKLQNTEKQRALSSVTTWIWGNDSVIGVKEWLGLNKLEKKVRKEELVEIACEFYYLGSRLLIQKKKKQLRNKNPDDLSFGQWTLDSEVLCTASLCPKVDFCNHCLPESCSVQCSASSMCISEQEEESLHKLWHFLNLKVFIRGSENHRERSQWINVDIHVKSASVWLCNEFRHVLCHKKDTFCQIRTVNFSNKMDTANVLKIPFSKKMCYFRTRPVIPGYRGRIRKITTRLRPTWFT